MDYLIGQRVIIAASAKSGGGKEIGQVVVSETGETHFGAWVFSPSRGHASDYALTSVRPLPNDQF